MLTLDKFTQIYVNSDAEVRTEIEETLDMLQKMPSSPGTDLHIWKTIQKPYLEGQNYQRCYLPNP